jgi:hypothetical protein
MSDKNKNNPKASTNVVNNHPKKGVMVEHPVGVGIGAVGVGAAAGAAGGAIGGPVGAVAGAAIGAVVGGVTGDAVAEAIDPIVETGYWRTTYNQRPYTDEKLGFDHYEPAYRYGWESFDRLGGNGHSFSSIEADLGRGWKNAKGTSHMEWDQAKSATKDAWDRIKTRAHGPSKRTHASSGSCDETASS